MDDHAAHANSFGPVAEIYERGRPPYPPEAIDWLVPDRARHVVDLGAGTGKLTRQLLTRGLDVTAVDPSPGMLAELERVVPEARVELGPAEAIPLPDASADAVLVAQAWHWVDEARAVPEVARVLVPGGRLGLIWNRRDERRGWVRRLGEIVGAPERPWEGPLGGPFGAVEEYEVSWAHRITADELLDLVASRSYVILRPADQRAAVLAQVRQLTVTHPELVGRTAFEMPYVTRCYRAHTA